MLINPVSLIAGALSFSAALAWNKAVSDTLTKTTGTNSTIFQAIIITVLIIIIVYIINMGLKIYTDRHNVPLKDHVIKAGNREESKVKLLII